MEKAREQVKRKRVMDVEENGGIDSEKDEAQRHRWRAEKRKRWGMQDNGTLPEKHKQNHYWRSGLT